MGIPVALLMHLSLSDVEGASTQRGDRMRKMTVTRRTLLAGGVPSNLRAAIPDATFLEGLAVEGTSVDGARDEAASWTRGLSLAG